MTSEETISAIMELHKPVTYLGYTVCEECNSLCHSREGIMCDIPADGMYPCDTVKIVIGQDINAA